MHDSRAFPGSLPGHFLGIAGAAFMLMALFYSFRKRILKKRGKQNPINRHITYGLLGSSLVVIHSGHAVSSLIGMFIFLSVLLVVLSGIAGYYLYKRVTRTLKDHKKDSELLKAHLKKRRHELLSACRISEPDDLKDVSPPLWRLRFRSDMMDECARWTDEVRVLADKEYIIRFFDRLKSIFTKWIRVHYTMAFLLFALLVVHVLTTLYYGLRWLP